MGTDRFSMLSEERREAAHRALAAALGATAPHSVVPIAGGATQAAVFRIGAADRRYLLRIEGPASPLRNPHQYTSLQIAAAAGIAPAVHYVDETAGVMVADFIEQRPLQEYPGGAPALAQALGALLHRLQATPVFPHFVDYPDIVARLFAHVRRTGLFADGLLDAHVARLTGVRAAYMAGATRLVSSHNDANPRNILFDGRRLWLIDWESAYRNDPLIDVAVMLDSVVRQPALDDTLLQACFDRAPDDDLRGRLALARALTRLYFAGVMLSASAAAPRDRPETDLSAPTPAAFQKLLDEGLLGAGTVETKHILGKMFLASFLDGIAPPGFDAAV